jgi:EmrB/QacA subfamily drug resistance transporter
MTEANPTVGAVLPAPPLAQPAASQYSGSRGGFAALAIVGIFLSLLMGALDNFVVLTALPNIVTDLKQPSGTTFVVSAYLITSTVSVPIFAKISDLLSRRNVFITGLVVFIAGSILSGLSQNLNELILFRGLQGVGAGAFFPVGISIVAVLFSGETRARVTGLLSGVFGIATVAGPFLGSFIVDHTTWRWVFYINIPVGVLGIAVIAASLGPLRPQVRGRFDVPGAAFLSVWVGALMFALFQVSDAGWGWLDPRILGLLATTLVGFAAFIGWELRALEPLVPLRLFGRRVVAASSGVAFLRGFAVFSLFTFVAVFIGIVILHGASGAADTVRDVLYFLVIPMIVTAALGGQLVTRLPYRPVVATGMGLAALGLFFLARVNASTPTWQFAAGFLPSGGIILPLIPIGAGAGLTFSATILSVQYEVPDREVGSATGLVQFMQGLGAAMGVSLFTTFQRWRFQSLSPGLPTPACFGASPPASCLAYFQQLQIAAVTSFDNVFQVMFLLATAGAVIALFLTGRVPKRSRPSPANVE